MRTMSMQTAIGVRRESFVSSTGALVVFSPARVTAMQETQWYCVSAGALFLVAAAIALTCGPGLIGTVEK